MNIRPDWKSIEELPEWDHRPMRQFVHIEGWASHSNFSWRRQVIGDARIDREGPQGYKKEDLERLMEMSDMDGGEVSHWAPFVVMWPSGT